MRFTKDWKETRMDLKPEIPPKYEINWYIWLAGPVNLTRGEFLLWCREAKSTFFFS